MSPDKLSPFYQTAQGLQAKFVAHHGWQVPAHFGSTTDEVTAAQMAVGLADTTAMGRVLVQGKNAGTFLTTQLAAPDLNIEQGTAVNYGQLFRLRHDQYYLLTAPDRLEPALEVLQPAAQAGTDLITLTDQSHGRCQLTLLGPLATAVLRRLCGLDFHNSQFPNLTAKSSSVAKTRQTIVRHDVGKVPAFSLIGSRSLGAYLWQTILQAGQSHAIRPIGQEALRHLQEQASDAEQAG